MVVLSLFDGISCGQQALKELGLHINKYYASEINKYAISITQRNFPNTIQLGNIEKWRDWNIEWSEIDLVQGGSPCQGFSFAGKQLNFDDPRSKLFFVFMDILNHVKKHNPNVKFLLENVRMKKEYSDKITELLGVNYVMINSALVSAQNRVRYYWTNIAEIKQPEDRGILLKDILEYKAGVGGAQRGRYIVHSKRADNTVKSIAGKTKQRIETRKDGKSNCLTSVTKDSLVVNRCIQVGEVDIKGHDSIKRVYSPWEQYKNKSRRQLVGTELHWRKLTPLECERLQTLPDGYTAKGINEKGEVVISNSQRYKVLGNAWTLEVIKHIYKHYAW